MHLDTASFDFEETVVPVHPVVVTFDLHLLESVEILLVSIRNCPAIHKTAVVFADNLAEADVL